MSSLSGFVNKYVIEGRPGVGTLTYFELIHENLIGFFTYHRNIKFRLVLVCMMEKKAVEDKDEINIDENAKAYFSSLTLDNLESTDVEKLIYNSYLMVDAGLEAYTEKRSGWGFKEVVQLEIHTTEYNPTKGSSYIPLPEWIKNKKAIVNIKNKDDKCCLWCILRYLYPKERDEERIKDLEKYEFSVRARFGQPFF